MKNFYYFATFCFLFFNSVFGQEPGGFYANISGNFSLCTNGESRTITADYRKLAPITATNPVDGNYFFEQIPYNNPFSFTGGNQIPIPPVGENQDDFFSPIFDLPFDFLFYGQYYNKLLVNSNGVLTFDTVNYQPGAAGWSWILTNGGVPINIPDPDFPILNAIYGVYQDINFTQRPLPTTSINYTLYNSGPYAAPNRVFVMNTNQVLAYPNETPLSSYQIILYENTNIIDINVKSRSQNPAWQGGAGVLGLQNADGTKATVPLGRNTGDVWEVLESAPESWRFYPPTVVPRLAPNTTVIKWYRNGALLPDTTDAITVNAVIGDVYKYVVTHTFLDGTTTFNVNSPIKTFTNEQSNSSLNPVDERVDFCQGDVVNIVQDTDILNGLNPNNFVIEYYQELAQVGTGNTIPPALMTNYTPPAGETFPQTIYISILDYSGPGACPPIVRPITLNVNTPASGTFSYGTAPFCLASTAPVAVATNTLTAGGSFVSATLDVDMDTGEIRNFGSLPSGPYVVEYIFLPVPGCPPVPNASVTINIASCGCAAENVGPICITSAFNLTAPILPGATQYIWTGPGNPPNIQNPTGIIIPAGTPGPYVYDLVIRDAANLVLCTTTRTVLISAPPSAPIVASAPIPYCVGEAPAALQATGDAGSSLLWYTDLTGGSGSSTIPPVITTADGTFLFYVSQTVAGCESARATITVQVKPKPSAPIVTQPNVNYCVGNTASSLDASVTNFASLSGVQWYTPTSGGGFLVSGLAPTPSTTSVTSKTYFVTQTVNGCESSQIAINVTVTASQAITSATGTFTVCELGTLNLNTLATPSAIVSAWSTLDTAIATVDATTGIVTGVSAGSAVITFTNISGCKVDKSITVFGSSIINGATSLCVGTSTSQLTTTPTSSGTWSTNAPSVATVSSTGLVTAVGSGTVVIKFVNAAGCESTKSISVTSPPNILSATPGVFSVCILNTLDLNALNLPSNTVTAWTSADASIATVDATNGLVTGVAQGSTLIKFVDINGCEDTQLITVNPTPIITEVIAGNYTVCVGRTIAMTSTSAPAIGNPWSISNGIAFASINASGVVSGLSSGTAEVSFTGSNGCIGKKTITISAVPSAPIVAELIYCRNQIVTTALTAIGAPLGTLLWYANAVGGSSGAAPIPSTATLGDKFYYVSQVVNGCESPRAALKVTINQIPSAPVVTTIPIQYCIGDVATALTVISGNSGLLWYDSPTDLTGNTVPTIPSTSSIGTIQYYVTQTVGCESPKAMISVKVNGIPSAPTVSNLPIKYCQGATNAVPLTASGTGSLLWYSVPNDGIGTSTAPTPSTINSGNQFFYVSQTINNCPSSRALITVQITPIPNAPIVSSPLVLCKDQTVTQPLTAIGQGTLLWYANATGGFGGSAPIPNTSTVIDRDYYVSQKVNDCESPRVKLTVSTVAAPNLVLNSSLIEKCAPETANLTDPLLTATSQTGILTYWKDADAINEPISAQSASQISLSGTYYIKLTTNTCFTIKSIQVKINPKPIVTLDQNGFVCVDVAGATLVGSDYTLDTNFDTPQYSFAWFNNSISTTVPISGATSGSLTVDKAGTYTVKVTNVATTCSSEATATVAKSLPPDSITFMKSSYFADDKMITVIVSPPGTYEFQLNNGLFQDSNVFVGVNSGDNKIVVRDKFGCAEVPGMVRLLDFPKFFSPNGDGINDVWNIADIDDQNSAKIFIYDRYGKLLKQITPTSSGWDGTFNSGSLPADDYWFTVDYQEDSVNKIFKSHFSLKR